MSEGDKIYFTIGIILSVIYIICSIYYYFFTKEGKKVKNGDVVVYIVCAPVVVFLFGPGLIYFGVMFGIVLGIPYLIIKKIRG